MCEERKPLADSGKEKRAGLTPEAEVEKRKFWRGDGWKSPELPAPFQASTLRLIADHFDAHQGKKIIINPDSKMREEWAILLNQIADDLEGG